MGGPRCRRTSKEMDKEYILKEIIRTTHENNGVPLGIQRFSKITGITTNDWLGRYWARWGDALTEAGYAPNKMISALNEGELIDKVVSFIRELGRLPTTQEVHLKARNTPGFPWHNTIMGRLGGTQLGLAQKIIEYTEQKPECADIFEICKKYVNTHQVKEVGDTKQSITELGFVYLMKSGRFYKIGMSDDVGRRQYDIGIKLPEPLKVLHKISTDDPCGIEAYWHDRFKGKRRQGEWFDLSPADIVAFKRRKFM